jgi:hypothetical protein
MGTPEIDLNALAAGLDPAQVHEVADFIGYLRAKRERAAAQAEPTAEDRAWMDADLSRLGEFEPFDWGEEGPPKGRPVIWDPAAGAFIVEGGKSEPR